MGVQTHNKKKLSAFQLRQKRLKNTKIGKIKIKFAQYLNETFIKPSENNEECLFAVDFLPRRK